MPLPGFIRAQTKQPARLQAIWTRAAPFRLYAYPLALAVIVLVLAALRISGTSVGIYHDAFFGSSQDDPARIFGEARDIRSDEFLVATPWLAAQAQRGFPRVNDLYGVSGQSLLFYDLPVADITLVFKPHNWGFLFLPLENAFALRWWLRAAVFLLAAYLLLLRISRKRALLSATGSLALFFSPHFQWWYSVQLLDITAYALLLFECFIRLVRAEQTRHAVLYTFLLTYLSAAFALFFYPPAQIPSAWLLLLFGAGLLWRERTGLTERKVKVLAAAALAWLVMVAAFAVAFYRQYAPALERISGTVYPGRRAASGGGFPLEFLAGNFFNIQLLNPGATLPPFFSNNPSMASGFFFYSLFLAPVMAGLMIWAYRRKQAFHPFTVLLLAAFLLLLLWEVCGLPAFVARLLLAGSVPAIRVLLALGVVNFFLSAWFLWRVEIPTGRQYFWFSAIYAGLVFAFYLGFGWYLRAHFPAFLFNPIKIGLVALAAGLGVWLLLQKRAALFIFLLLAFSALSSYRANPLYQGLGELTSGELAQAVQQINRTDGGRSRWVVYDSTLLMNFLQASGARALSGVYYYPDIELWRAFDPSGEFEPVYNRYARTMFRPVAAGKPRFELTYRDAMTVYIDPCDPLLERLDVRYFVFPYPAQFTCLEEVRQVQYPNIAVFIYRRSGETGR